MGKVSTVSTVHCQDGESLHKTRTKRRTLDPVWDSEVELFLRGTPRLNLKVDSFTKISFLVGLSVNYSLFRCMIGTELSLTTLWVDIANSNNKKHLRGAPETNFRSKLGFCPKRLDNPPPRTLGFPKRKKKNVYLAF